MSNMVITKLPRDKEHPFTMTSNDPQAFNWDTKMTPGAYGVLCKVLSLNPEKDFSVSWLCELLNVGRTAARNILKELVQLGYLVIEKIRDELGRFKETVYRFYESPQLSQQEGEKPSKLNDCPQSRNPDAGEQQQLNTTTSSNTSSVIKSVSPVQEQTDEKQDEKFTALQNELAELSAYPFLKEGEFKDFVADMLPRMTEAALRQQNVQEKLLEIGHKECSLFSFLNKLKARCEKALKNLKYPKARDKFLLTTIQNAVQEYEIESPEQETPEKQPVPEKKSFTFNGILRLIGSSFGTLPDSFKSEEELSCFDACDRQVEECRIPKEFAYSSAVSEAEQALRFLFCYSYLDDEENLEYKEFTGTVARCLAEVICTGMKNSVRGADADAVIDRLNQINQYDSGSLVQWLNDFANHYSEKLVEARVAGQKIRNRYAYLKACAVNYLLKDSCSGDPFLYDNIF